MNKKKIILALDSSPATNFAISYALELFSDEPILFYGVVFEPTGEGASENPLSRKEVIKNFENRCDKEKVQFIVQQEKGVDPESILLSESRFADLLIVGYESAISGADESKREKLLKHLLRNSHCPVLIVPQSGTTIDNIILTYDGKPSSFFAIKQFIYLMGELNHNRQVTLLTVLDEDEITNPSDEKLLVQYLKLHCKDLAIHKVAGESKEAILKAVEYTEKSLVVMGAFGRNTLSMLFSSSAASKVLKAKSAPAFITHL